MSVSARSATSSSLGLPARSPMPALRPPSSSRLLPSPPVLSQRLSTKEAETHIGTFFAKKIGLYILKIVIILDVGNEGTCWFQEIEPEILIRYATNDPPYEIVRPTTTLACKSRKMRGILIREEKNIQIFGDRVDDIWYSIPLAAISTISGVSSRR